MKLIRSRDNPGFKAVKALTASARERRRHGLTLLEGSHLVAAYRDKLGKPQRLIVSEAGAARAEIATLLETLGDTDTQVLKDSLFSELSTLTTPTGIIALVAIPSVPENTKITGSCILLDGLQDAGNVGSILRTAAAAGIRDLFLGPGCAAAWAPRVLRAAQGAHFDLSIREHVDLAAVLAKFPGISIAATAHGGSPLFELDLAGPIGWLFGNEGAGVSVQLASQVQLRTRIPMAAGTESLNVAAAAAICLFEEARQKATATGRRGPRRSARRA